jgi:aryl-alcohol dehydrogenase-like predicted oxidoreductase
MKQRAAPILGVSKLEHLETAVGALEVSLNQEEQTFLQEPYLPHPVLGHE